MKPLRRSSLHILSLVVAVGAASCTDGGPILPDAATAPAPSSATSQTWDFVSGRLIVGLVPGAAVLPLATGQGVSVERTIGENVWMFRVPEGTETQWAESLRRNRDVRFAEPDYLRTFGDITCALCALTGGGFMGYKWDLQNDGVIVNSAGTVLASTGLAGADMDWTPAFEQLGADFSGAVRVAILDTGVRADHEDLVGRIVGGYNFNNNTTNYTDDNGHGTHVAGIIAARAGNGKGLAGVAWGPNVRLLIVKVCGQSQFGYACSDSAIFQGINWAISQGADVINISLGGSAASNSVRTALQNALANDVLPICAAGNNGQAVVTYPAAFAECVAISATDWGDNLASYSNWGSPIDLSAPGGDSESPSGYSYILSSYNQSPTSYVFMSGTSMAAPQVTGLAALLYSLGMTSASAVLDLMKTSADDLGASGYDTRFGHGRINVARAVQSLVGNPTPNQPPTADFSYSCAGLVCSFTDTSVDTDGQVTGWSWSFGDGSTSTQRNPTRTYAAGQNYTVALTVTDDRGAAGQRSRIITVTAPPPTPPTAGYTYSCAFLVCTFYDASAAGSAPLGGRSWSFGDGTPNGVGTQLQHTFPAAGTYSVTLTVTDNNGLSDPETKSLTVQPPPPPPTGPTAAYTYSCTFLVCTFTDASTAGSGAISVRVWSFGDGTPAGIGPVVQHTFLSAGSYSVTLTVADGNNLSDPETKSVTVQAAPPPPTPPTAGYTYSCNLLVCTFTDASTAGSTAIASNSWSFGDGSPTESGTSVQHTFPASGSYSVTLTVTDGNGLSDPETRSVTVQTSSIALTATGIKVWGRNTVNLVWSGATTSHVVIQRNGVNVILRTNQAQGNNAWTDTPNVGGATLTYRVCQADALGNPTSVCSPNVQVTF